MWCHSIIGTGSCVKKSQSRNAAKMYRNIHSKAPLRSRSQRSPHRRSERPLAAYASAKIGGITANCVGSPMAFRHCGAPPISEWPQCFCATGRSSCCTSSHSTATASARRKRWRSDFGEVGFAAPLERCGGAVTAVPRRVVTMAQECGEDWDQRCAARQGYTAAQLA